MWHCRWVSLIIGLVEEEIKILFSHVTSRVTLLRCHVTLWVMSLIIHHYPARFGSHRPHRKVDTLFLICHMASQGNIMALLVGASHPKWWLCRGRMADFLEIHIWLVMVCLWLVLTCDLWVPNPEYVWWVI